MDLQKPLLKSPLVITRIEALVIISIIALVIGILWPAVPVHHPAARSTSDRAHLRQIGVALYSYAIDHDEVLPGHPRDVAEYFNDPLQFESVCLNPYQGDNTLIDRWDSAGVALRFGGYVFLNLGMDTSDMENPVEIVLAYTAKVSSKQKRRSVLFADSHVELLEDFDLRALLPPELDVDALDGP